MEDRTIEQVYSGDIEIGHIGAGVGIHQNLNHAGQYVFVEMPFLGTVAVELIRRAAGSLTDDQRAALLILLQPTPDPTRSEALRRLAQAEQDNCND